MMTYPNHDDGSLWLLYNWDFSLEDGLKQPDNFLCVNKKSLKLKPAVWFPLES